VEAWWIPWIEVGRELFWTKKKPPDQRQEVSTATICGCCRYIRRSRFVQVITAKVSPMFGRALPQKGHVMVARPNGELGSLGKD
jgi:hypothetical protein